VLLSMPEEDLVALPYSGSKLLTFKCYLVLLTTLTPPYAGKGKTILSALLGFMVGLTHVKSGKLDK